MKVLVFVLLASAAQAMEASQPSQVQPGNPSRSALQLYIGTDDFERLILKSSVFVDKTLFIKEIFENRKDILLFTRPQRWGKSLTLSMVKYFFHQEVDAGGRPFQVSPHRILFEGGKVDLGQDAGGIKQLNPLKIALDPQWENKYKYAQGQYPTILLSLKDVQGFTFEEMKASIERQLLHLFAQFRYLPSIKSLFEVSKGVEIEFYERIEAQIIEEKTIGRERSLRTLSEWLSNYHGKRTYILVDEYDTPLNQAYMNGYGPQAAFLMRGLFGAAFKSNPALEKGILIGILQVAKADLFSSLNDLSEDTILDEQYAPYLGFTENEVNDLLQLTQIKDTRAVKEWYNGYRIGNETIYNPWSLMNYLLAIKNGSSNPLKPYWVDSGGVDLIKQELFSQVAKSIWRNVESGKDIFANVEKFIYLTDLNSPNDLHSLLLHTGYLTLAPTPPGYSGVEIPLRIPNKEIRLQFERLIESDLQRHEITEPSYVKRGFELILKEDIKALNQLFRFVRPKIDFGPWNFNFLQMAALQGNKKLFDLVWRNFPELRSARTEEDLGVRDFAVLGGTDFPQLEGYRHILRRPHLHEYGCWVIGFIPGVVTGVVDLLYHNAHQTPSSYALQASAFVLKAVFHGEVVQLYLTEQCKNFSWFQKIDISRPMDLNELTEFGKYVVYHPSSYIAVNQPCRPTHREIAAFHRPAVSIRDIEFIHFRFSLCGLKPQPVPGETPPQETTEEL